MDTMPVGASADEGLVASDARGFRDTIGRGLGCSALLHLLIALLFAIGLPVQAPPPVEVPVSVEFAPFDQEVTSAGRQEKGRGQPEKPPPEAPEPQPIEARSRR